MSQAALQELLHHPRIWKGFSQRSLSDQRTGFAALDRLLPGHGWPRQALIEVMSEQLGIGELQLLLPILRGCAQCWINPPHIPYAPALSQLGIDLKQLLIIQPQSDEDALWALGEVLRSGLYPQVLAWHDTGCMTALRRLQLAAERGGGRLFLFRPKACVRHPSPAALRLFLQASPDGLYLRALKIRGGQPGAILLTHNDFMACSTVPTTATGSASPRAA